MRSLPDKLALNDGDPKAQVAEYANSWTHGGPQQAHRQQPNHTEEAEQPSESHFACTRYADLQQHIVDLRKCTGSSPITLKRQSSPVKASLHA